MFLRLLISNMKKRKHNYQFLFHHFLVFCIWGELAWVTLLDFILMRKSWYLGKCRLTGVFCVWTPASMHFCSKILWRSDQFEYQHQIAQLVEPGGSGLNLSLACHYFSHPVTVATSKDSIFQLLYDMLLIFYDRWY